MLPKKLTMSKCAITAAIGDNATDVESSHTVYADDKWIQKKALSLHIQQRHNSYHSTLLSHSIITLRETCIRKHKPLFSKARKHLPMNAAPAVIAARLLDERIYRAVFRGISRSL